MRLRINWDGLGIATSIACAIHCAVLPLIISSLPLFGINVIENTAFEFCMIFLAMGIGVYSLYHGYKKHHHRIVPIVIFTAGILLLFAKQLWHEAHIWLLVPAVVAIVSAHLYNFRFCRVHNHAHSEDCAH